MVVDALAEAEPALRISEKIFDPAEFQLLDDSIIDVSHTGWCLDWLVGNRLVWRFREIDLTQASSSCWTALSLMCGLCFVFIAWPKSNASSTQPPAHAAGERAGSTWPNGTIPTHPLPLPSMQVIENFDLFRRQLNVSEDDEAAIARAQVGADWAEWALPGSREQQWAAAGTPWQHL